MFHLDKFIADSVTYRLTSIFVEPLQDKTGRWKGVQRA